MVCFMCMLRLLQKKGHVLTADTRVKRYTVVMYEFFTIFPFLGIGWLFIWGYASSSAKITNAIKQLLPSSLELKCSAIADALADVKSPLPDMESRHHQIPPAGFCPCWAYP